MTQTQQHPDAVLTPTVRSVARRSVFWLGVAAVIGVVIVAGAVAFGGARGGVPLAPDNPAPAGAMALAEVLADRGVTVIATSSLEQTTEVLEAGSTLLVVDTGHLDADQWSQLRELAERVIVVEPSFLALRGLAPLVAPAGVASGPFSADCGLPEVRRAGTVSGPASGYRLLEPVPGARECLGAGDDAHALITLPTDSGELVVLGAHGALSNEWIGFDGNAAFALGLLGSHPTLVWYLPSLADVDPAEVPPTAGELTPPWVVPVLALLLAVFLAAAVWRGRRFGPLVVEKLPVTPRASETMHGRARLYQRSASRLRALDALRIGAVERIAADCGLPRTATVDEVILAAAAATGRPQQDLRALLLDTVPHSDAELVQRSDDLARLEQAVHAAVRPQ